MSSHVMLGGSWRETITHADSPFTPTVGGHQFIPFDTTDGSITINTPGPPIDGMVLGLKPITSSANLAVFHANNGDGESIENPMNPTDFVTDVDVNGPRITMIWKYRESDKKWIVLSV